MTILKHLRTAVLRILRRPVMPLTVILLLGAGMGAAVSLYGIADAVLFRPLTVATDGQLVRFFRQESDGNLNNWSRPHAEEVAAVEGVFADHALYAGWPSVNVVDDAGAPRELDAALVSGRYFQMLGTNPVLGRLITEADDNAVSEDVAVLSHALWQSRYAGREDIVGSVININEQAVTVIGVLPAGFTGLSLDQNPQLWMSLHSVGTALPSFNAEDFLNGPGFAWLEAAGVLKAGVSMQQAQQAISAWRSSRVAGGESFPAVAIRDARAVAIDAYGDGSAKRISWLLIGLAVTILIVACADASGLMLMRAEAQRGEAGIRMGMGASPLTIAIEKLVEGAVIAMAAMVFGLGVAWAASGWLLNVLGNDLGLAGADPSISLSWRLLLLGVAMVAAASLLTSWAPARQLAAVDIARVLGQQRSGSSNRQRLLREALVSAQMVISVVLLVTAGLMLNALYELMRVDPGFRVADRAAARINIADQGAASKQFMRELLTRLENDPRVSSAALGFAVPVQSAGIRLTVRPSGYTQSPEDPEPHIDLNPVSADYFSVLGIEMLRGRMFDDAASDSGQSVAVVNQAFVDRFWPESNPIGQRLGGVGGEAGAEVIGVVANNKQRSLREQDLPIVYAPLWEWTSTAVSVVVHGRTADEAFDAIVENIRQLNPEQTIGSPATLRQRLDDLLVRDRALSSLATISALFATLLAAAGVYGMAAYSARRRRRELGIRTALGARHVQLVSLVAARAGGIGVVSLAAGVLTALLVSRALESAITGLDGSKIIVYVAAGVVALGVFLLATVIPVWRASKVPPMEVLRNE